MAIYYGGVASTPKLSDLAANGPAKPTDLAAEPSSTSQIDLSWTDNAGDEDGYKVYRSTDRQFYNEIDDIAADSTSYNDATIDAGVTYYYMVSAYNSDGESFSEPAYANTLTLDLTSYWHLYEASGARSDAHGSNDLTDNNTVLSADGIQDLAADFERSNSEYLSHASNSDLQIGDNDFTFAFWIKLEDLAAGAEIIAKDGVSSDREYRIRTGGGSFNDMFFDFYDGNTTRVARIQVASDIVDSEWHFYIVWYSTADNKIYLERNNNGNVHDATLTGTPGTGSADFTIGHAGTTYMDGLLAKIPFWKRVLTDAERDALWSGGRDSFYDFGEVYYRPTLTGYSTSGQAHTHGIALFGSGQYALTADWTGGNSIDCWDISDPTNPTILDTITGLTGGPLYVTIDPGEQYAYTGEHDVNPGTFKVIDISDPNNISIVGTLSNAGLYGAQEMVVKGNYVMVAGRYANQISVIDVSTKNSPSLEGSISGSGSPNYLQGVTHLELSDDGNTLFAVGSQDNHVSSFDVSSLPSISLLDSLGTNLTTPHEIWYDAGYLYIANIYSADEYSGALVVYDVSDPSNMSYVTQILMDGTDADNTYYLDHVHGLWLDGDYLYAVANAQEPTAYPRPWNCSLNKFDVSDPTNPILLWSYQDRIYLNGAHHLEKYGDYLFIASYALPGLVVYYDP